MTVQPRSNRRAALVILCGDLADRLDLDAVEELLAPTPVVVVDGLCRDPGAVARTLGATGCERAVVGLCSGDVPTADLLSRARRAGAEPFGVAPISLAAAARASSTADACRTLAAAVARVRALPAGENGRAALGRASLSRASLLSLGGAISIEPVAAVEAPACVGATRCGLCVSACPQQAIVANGTVGIDPNACDACGRCVPVCPVGAIHLTGAASAQVAAQLAVLLPETEVLVYRCRHATISSDDLPAGWATIELASLAPVTTGWILQALAGGARAVRLAPCTRSCCSESAGRVAFSRRVLAQHEAGDPSRRVALLSTAADDTAGLDPVPAAAGAVVLEEPRATVEALDRLAPALETAVVEHEAAPLGLLQLDADGCTLCGSCALVCPTAALTLDASEAEVALSHDPRLCTGCSLCVAACPEHVISMRRGLDGARLAAGEVELARGRRRTCAGCGAELPSDAIVRRVRELLGTSWLEPESFCPECARRAS